MTTQTKTTVSSAINPVSGLPYYSDDLMKLIPAISNGDAVVNRTPEQLAAIQETVSRVINDEEYQRIEDLIADAKETISYLMKEKKQVIRKLDDSNKRFNLTHPIDPETGEGEINQEGGQIADELRDIQKQTGVLLGKIAGYNKQLNSRAVEVMLLDYLIPNMERTDIITFKSLTLFLKYVFHQSLNNRKLQPIVNEYSSGRRVNCWKFGIKHVGPNGESQEKIAADKKKGDHGRLSVLRQIPVVTPDRSHERYPHSNIRIPESVAYQVTWAWKEIARKKKIEFPEDVVSELNTPIITPETPTNHLEVFITPDRRYNYYLDYKNQSKNFMTGKPISERLPEAYHQDFIIPGVDEDDEIKLAISQLRQIASKMESDQKAGKSMLLTRRVKKFIAAEL